MYSHVKFEKKDFLQIFRKLEARNLKKLVKLQLLHDFNLPTSCQCKALDM